MAAPSLARVVADWGRIGVGATNLLPGPALTHLAIYCGWRVRVTAGAVAGGLAFILPGLLAIVALAGGPLPR